MQEDISPWLHPQTACPGQFASPLWTGRMSQRSQRLREFFDTGFLHQVLGIAFLFEVASDNQPVHLGVDLRQIVRCGAAANENR